MSQLSFKETLGYIEKELSLIYQFEIKLSALDCIISSPESVKSIEQEGYRAALLLKEDSDNLGLELGICFESNLASDIEKHNPLTRLDQANLDALCILVEELSHFHLVVNRAQADKGVSKLELEWQGEVDKWLIAVSIIEGQTGNPHFEQLSRLIFYNSICYAKNSIELYEQAHRLAGLYCHKIMPQIMRQPHGKKSSFLKQSCRTFYHLQWPAKLKALANF